MAMNRSNDKIAIRYGDRQRSQEQWRHEWEASSAKFRTEARAVWADLKSIARGEQMTPEERRKLDELRSKVREQWPGLKGDLSGLGRDFEKFLPEIVMLPFTLLVVIPLFLGIVIGLWRVIFS